MLFLHPAGPARKSAVPAPSAGMWRRWYCRPPCSKPPPDQRARFPSTVRCGIHLLTIQFGCPRFLYLETFVGHAFLQQLFAQIGDLIGEPLVLGFENIETIQYALRIERVGLGGCGRRGQQQKGAAAGH
jgi:hypothetical protein